MSSSLTRPRSRSPRFPSYAIRDAIVYAEKIYQAVHRSPIDAQTAFRLMGFAGKSGASASALGAVRQYGLIEGTGDRTRVSDLALKVLEPVSPEERNEAILEAAFSPEAFKAIMDRFVGRVPTSDEPVRAFLIRELGFSKRGAEECTSALRGTLEVVREIRPDTSSESQIGRETRAQEPVEHELDRVSIKAGNQHSMLIPLTPDCTVELRFSGSISGKALTHLIRHLELTKDVWSEA